MELAPAGVSLSFEVTFDSDDLFVGMSVYDDSGVSPVLVQGPDLMLNVVGNTYRGKFTATAGKSYIIFKAVYTNETMLFLDNNYSQGSESIKAEDLASGSGDCTIIGLVYDNNEIVGLVDSNDAILGVVDNNNEIIGVIEC